MSLSLARAGMGGYAVTLSAMPAMSMVRHSIYFCTYTPPMSLTLTMTLSLSMQMLRAQICGADLCAHVNANANDTDNDIFRRNSIPLMTAMSTNRKRGRPRKNLLRVGQRQPHGYLQVVNPNAGVSGGKRVCICVCHCGHCDNKHVKVAVYRFLSGETRSCHHLRRANYRALKQGKLKTRKTMASEEQMKFHGAMMRILRKYLRDKKFDNSQDAQKALRYAQRLQSDDALRNNVAEGLKGDFSIETDIGYIRRALVLADKQQLLDTDAAPGRPEAAPSTSNNHLEDEDVPF